MQWILKKPVTLSDGSAFLTGLLLAMNLPANVPLYIPFVGSFVAIMIAKHLFGGLGFQHLQPRADRPRVRPGQLRKDNDHLRLRRQHRSWPLTRRPPPRRLSSSRRRGWPSSSRCTTPRPPCTRICFVGNQAGSLGETSVIALLLGGAFLLMKRYITWHIPVPFIATVGLLTWIFGGKEGLMTGDPIFHMMSGGLVLGAFFMATDYVTGPSVRSAQVVFGICAAR